MLYSARYHFKLWTKSKVNNFVSRQPLDSDVFSFLTSPLAAFVDESLLIVFTQATETEGETNTWGVQNLPNCGHFYSVSSEMIVNGGIPTSSDEIQSSSATLPNQYMIFLVKSSDLNSGYVSDSRAHLFVNFEK